MKKDIHPTYYEEVKIQCACGNVIEAGSTEKALRTEICSACHPFYTGKQKLVDTAGRIDKFRAKMVKAAEKKVKAAEAKKERAEKKAEEMNEKPSKKGEKSGKTATKAVKSASGKKKKK